MSEVAPPSLASRDGTSRNTASAEPNDAERDHIWRLSRDLMVVLDRKGQFRSVNPAATRMLGWAASEMVGRSVFDFVHPDDRPPLVDGELVPERLSDGRELLNRYRDRNGAYHWLSWVAVLDNGLIYANGRDVTAERERETALADSRDFARLALSSVGGVGVWTYVVANDRFYCDAAIADLYGIDADEAAAGILRERFLANLHPDDVSSLKATMSGGLRNPGDLELEYRILHPDGTTRWVLSRGHTYFDPAGVPVRRTGVGIEMTRQRLMEEQLRHSQKMEAIGQLTGGVAHDFNNLLTVIRGAVDMLARPDITEHRRQRYIEAISDTVTRAARLTGQLLAFSRRQTLRPAVFDVGHAVSAVGDMLGTLTGSHIEIVTRLPDEACYVRADPSQFDTALVNMAVNARDAMDGEGRLLIAVRVAGSLPDSHGDDGVDGPFVAISVTDTGSGIAPEQLKRIFEPFFTTKAVGHGTGLGLSQVFGFAKQSKGDITVDSVPSIGTTFTLYLPRANRSEETAKEDVEHAPLLEGHGTRVLIVEDNDAVGSFAMQTLNELGYIAELATNGAEALSRLAEGGRSFDAVFSDVVMPGMNGIDLGKEIARLYPNLPVVLASGYSHVLAEQGTHGFELLEKPYSMEELSLALRKASARQDHR